METPIIPVDLLVSGALELGIELTDEQSSLLKRFAEMLLEWNEKFNLTRITEPREIVIKHLLDSLTCLHTMRFPEGAKVIDVGTGAGLPGIVLKIVRPDISITLLDATQKKLTFIDAVVKELGLEKVSLLHGRAEETAHEPKMHESFDVVTARAVSEMRVLAEYLLPFARISGFVIAQKGPDVEEELALAKHAISILGGNLEKTTKLVLPYSDAARTLVVIRKASPTPRKYPRRHAEISKKPL